MLASDNLCGLRRPVTTPVISDRGDRGHGVVAIRGPLPRLVDAVHALQRDGVCSRGRAVANIVPVPPPVPVGLYHGAHFAVEVAVGKCDEEPGKGHRDVPREDEDGGKCCCCLLRPDDRDKICDS